MRYFASLSGIRRAKIPLASYCRSQKSSELRDYRLSSRERQSQGGNLSPIHHLQYGWWFAHWTHVNRRERAAIALAAAGPDLDGLALFGGGDAYYRYHHILFHNVGSTLAVIPLAGIFFWRRPLVWLLVVFAFGMHMVEDYFTVPWPMYPWEPFNASAVNLATHFPAWVVQYVFQGVVILFILGMTVWIYRRYHRTPLEIISPAFDRLIIGYAVLPWRNRCADCHHRAHFRCALCGRLVCTQHGKITPGPKVECKQCPKLAPTAVVQNSGVMT